MKTAKDIINKNSQKSNTVNKEALVIDAFNLMESENIDYTVVIEGDECVGIMSEVDYMHKIILARKDPRQTRLKEVMTNSLCAVDAKDPIHICLGLMDTFKIRHLLVFDNFLYQGVITLHDLMRAAYKENLDSLLAQEEANYLLSIGGYI